MKKSEVRIGETYSMERRYSGTVTVTHWRAVNLATGREIIVNSAMRLTPIASQPTAPPPQPQPSPSPAMGGKDGLAVLSVLGGLPSCPVSQKDLADHWG